MAQRTITLTLTYDPEQNRYRDGGHLVSSIHAGLIRPGVDVHIEFGTTGDVVDGQLVNIREEQP